MLIQNNSKNELFVSHHIIKVILIIFPLLETLNRIEDRGDNKQRNEDIEYATEANREEERRHKTIAVASH